MPTIDGAAAARTLLGYATLSQRGACLYYVWLAMKAHGATSAATYPTAYSAWQSTTRRHYDRNPPAGATVYWGRRSSDGNMSGDICISLGGGQVAATDYPSWGHVGQPTLDQRQAQIGREYLGWSEDFLVDNITVIIGSPTGGGTVTWDARAKQTFLVSLGLDTGGIDGIFGPKSQDATRTFQGWLGITVDGDFGPVTISKAEVIEAGHNATSRATAQIQAKVGATADGIWGNKTSLAVYRWQAANSLTADSIWGPASDAKAFPPVVQPPQTQWPTDGRNATSRPTKDIQTFLIGKGYDLGVAGADGAYGPSTSVAAAQYQASVGLTADGIWGPLTDAKAFGTAPVVTNNNPRGLPTYTPVYPGAAFGLVAPLGDGARGFMGNPPVPVPVIIDTFVIHWTSVANDQLDYFSYKNDRSSCPTWYLRQDGTAGELIRPKMKPCSTGSEWNWRSVAVEVLAAPDGPQASDAQLEWLAQAIAWLAGFDGVTLDGVPVSFKIDKDHVKGHRDAVATTCPGDYLYGKIPAILERAQQIYDAAHTPPVIHTDSYVIPKADMDGFLAKYVETTQ